MQEPKARYGIRGMIGSNYAGDGCVTDVIYIGFVIVPSKHNQQACFVVTNIGYKILVYTQANKVYVRFRQECFLALILELNRGANNRCKNSTLAC